MGTFVTDPALELFDDKTPAPGLSLRPGWTSANVLSAEEANKLRDACYDLREAHLELADTVEGASGVGNASPQPVAAAASVGVATAASREDHAHAHGNQAGGALHANATDAVAGFMSAASKVALDLATSNIATLQSDLAAVEAEVDGLAAATPSVSIQVAALPATLNMSTEGTIDWWHINTNATNPMPRLEGTAGAHKRKSRGEGDAYESFYWIPAVGSSVSLINTDLDFPCSTTATDCVSNVALSSFETGTYVYPAGTQVGFGFRFKVKAMKSQRVLRLYTGRNGCSASVYAALSHDGTSDTESVPVAGGTPTVHQMGRMITITFNGSVDGQWLIVELKAVTNHSGSSSTLHFYGITLAGS